MSRLRHFASELKVVRRRDVRDVSGPGGFFLFVVEVGDLVEHRMRKLGMGLVLSQDFIRVGDIDVPNFEVFWCM